MIVVACGMVRGVGGGRRWLEGSMGERCGVGVAGEEEAGLGVVRLKLQGNTKARSDAERKNAANCWRTDLPLALLRSILALQSW